MKIIDFLFKSKRKQESEKRIKEVLQRTDDFISRTERMLKEMEEDDKQWRKGL